jgi:predicted AlkP superfamily phosphohydrolase/phosphomutase
LDSSARKVFIVSLDGATFDVFRPLMQQGYMPHLARMMGEGLAAELESVVPPVTGLGLFDAPPEPLPEGCHRPKGVLLIQGDGLNYKVGDFRPRLIDMAPTILHLVGVPIPRDMDGCVLQDLWPDPQDICYEDSSGGASQHTQMDYSARDTELIEQRLKGLGHLE